MPQSSMYAESILRIKKEEESFCLTSSNLIEESYRMVSFLRNLLKDLKKKVIENGFLNVAEEIMFFKHIKPKILAKLVFYNKVSRIEMASPNTKGELYQKYYLNQMKSLNSEYRDHSKESEFYKYYRSCRSDRDELYFRLGNINLHDGLNSFVFEIDEEFSTYYDFKIARIIANDLLNNYLISKLEHSVNEEVLLAESSSENNEAYWSETKVALTEILYGLYVSGSICNGRISVKRLSELFQVFFKVDLGDVHHSFHRMKTRAGDRTPYLTHVKMKLEEYMDKNN